MRNSPIIYYRDIKNIKEQLYLEDRLRGLKTQIESAAKCPTWKLKLYLDKNRMKQQNIEDKDKILKDTKTKSFLQGKDKLKACHQQHEMPEVNK